jgi:hypothetical protein
MWSAFPPRLPGVIAAAAPSKALSGDLAGILLVVIPLAVLILPFVLYIAVRLWFGKRRERSEKAAKVEANRIEADDYFKKVALNGSVESVETSLT